VEKNWFNKINELYQKLRAKDNRRLMVFLVCLAIATVFWFLNALNKEYTVDLTFPVKYTNLPKNKILASSPPDHFTLKVNSWGFTILRHKLSMAFAPLVFNVNEFTAGQMENSPNSNFRIGTRKLINRFSNQVSNELKIVEIQPDSVYFTFDRVVRKKVKVKPEITYELKKQYYLSDEITTTPDSVVISGAESILDTIQFVRTRAQHYKELDKSIQRNVQLESSKNYKVEPARVILKIPLEEFTEKQVTVPITVTDVPENVNVKLFPDKAKINFMVGLSHFSDITENDFNLTVPYSGIEAKKEILKIRLNAEPQHILSVTVTPEDVEYLIEMK
jgi:hypothetical protein